MVTPTKKDTKSTIVSKKILVDRISAKKVVQKHALNKSQIELVINDFLSEVKKSLIHGEEIRLPSYFSFKTVMTKPRVGMNLQTKQKMTISAKRVPKIAFSK